MESETAPKIARKLKKHDNKLWDEITSCFNKQNDILKIKELDLHKKILKIINQYFGLIVFILIFFPKNRYLKLEKS